MEAGKLAGNRHPNSQLPSHPLPPAPTTAPGVQHSSVLAVFASIAANDILLAKVQNLPVHSCRSLAESERGGDYAYCPLPSTCPVAHLPLPTVQSCLPQEQCLAGIIEAGCRCCCCCKWLCLLWAFATTPALIRCRRCSVSGCTGMRCSY